MTRNWTEHPRFLAKLVKHKTMKSRGLRRVEEFYNGKSSDERVLDIFRRFEIVRG